MPVSIAAVMAVVSPSWLVPPVETVCEPVPVPDFLAALLAELVPVADPFAALCDPVPLVLLVLLAALLADFVPLAEPLPLLFEPVPDFEPPFFDFEPVWFVFMS